MKASPAATPTTPAYGSSAYIVAVYRAMYTTVYRLDRIHADAGLCRWRRRRIAVAASGPLHCAGAEAPAFLDVHCGIHPQRSRRASASQALHVRQFTDTNPAHRVISHDLVRALRRVSYGAGCTYCIRRRDGLSAR